MQNIIFSINVVVPIFVIVFLGIFLRRRNILNENFAAVSSNLSFQVSLPAMLFDDLAKTDLKGILDLKLIGFALAGILVFFIIFSLAGKLMIRDGKSRGAFVQGIFRSNFAILGLALASNALGQAGLTKSAVLLAFVIPLFNVLAVITLTINSSDSACIDRKGILKNIAKNPLIIAIVLALPFSYFQIPLPAILDNIIGYMSSIAIPLALLGMGCSFDFKSSRKIFGLTLTASLIKIVVMPLVLLAAAYFLGFRGVDLGVLFILFASPTAISSFVMAKAMDCDADLSAGIVLMTTIGSVITLSAGIFILKTFGLI